MGQHFGAVTVLQLGFVFLVLHSVDCEVYCDSETFNASCDLSQVVVMDEAHYGRIQRNRCVTSGHGIFGCDADVFNLLDRICSGRPSCQFSVIKLRELVEPCPKDLPSYLLATYSCVTVLDTTSVKCNESIILSSSDPPHYINYVIDQTSSPSPVTTPTFTTSQPSVAMTTSDTADAGVTTPFCPVIFSTQRKQRIDVTLYSFDLFNKSVSARGSESYLDNLRPCQFSVYVIDEGRQHSTVLCQAHNRVQLIYSMNSSRIVVYIGPSPNASKDQVTAQEFYGNYLIKVDAVVCPDLIPHPDSWNEKYGDRIIVRCHFSSETQAITREICHRVWYIATCPSETVIVIQSAVFSRMQSSRCIDFNTTDLECYGDFQLSVESRCDGESECLLDVYRFTNQRDYIEKCTKYPRRYMHVVYKCVDGASSTLHLKAARTGYQMEKHFRVVLQLGYVFLVLHNIGCEEYCDSETFEANCSSSQVIVMEEARYGRLRLGRCVTRDYGHVGCYADVLYVLDGICSGRRSCQLSVITLREFIQPCPRNLKSYMEASYSCVTVLDQKSVKCNDTTIDIRSGPSIYLQYVSDPDQMPSPSPSTTPTYTTSNLSDAGVKMPFCPLAFLTERGQRIDVTLYIFGSGKMPTGGSETYDHLRPCPFSVYVIDDGKQHSIDLCEARTRLQRIYTRAVSQKSNRVIVYFGPSPGSSKDQVAAQKFLGNYLIRVEVIGCIDFVPPPNSWREIIDGGRFLVRCNFSMESWHPVCKGNNWIGGPTNCPEDTAIREEVCIAEPLKVFCRYGTVIFIRSAVFGRMRNNRCIDFDTTDLDCYGNVQPHLEGVCNSHEECTIGSHIDTLRNAYVGRCSKDLTLFLHVVYTCIPEIVREICVGESYQAACPPGTAIFIGYALFGRERSSRCIDFDTTDLGCFVNVMPHLVGVCNGHRECIFGSHIDTTRNAYFGECSNNLTTFLHVLYTCVHVIQCTKFIPPENMTVEDLATGHRLSCNNDGNISWEVHCINNTWVSTPSESCDPSQAEDYDEGDSSFSEKVGIIVPCVTAALIISLAVVLVYIYMYKRRQRILINNEQVHTLSMLTESDE